MSFNPNDKAYRDWLHKQPCAICGYQGGCHAHHEPPKRIGCKDPSYWQRAVPLCGDHNGSVGCHTLRHLEKFSARIKAVLRYKAKVVYPRRYMREVMK
jgi:hypothetical protein